MTELHELTVTQASVLIAERSLSPVALMEALLARADALEPALRVWVTLDPDAALEDAAAQRAGARVGPGPWSPPRHTHRPEGHLQHERRAHHRLLAHLRRPRARPRRPLGGAAAAGRRGRYGQGGDDAVRQRRPIAHAQPLEHGTHAGRLQQRLGGGGGRAHLPRRDGVADRRLDPASGVVQRRGRPQAHIRARKQARRVPAGVVAGHAGAYRALRGGRRHRAGCARRA